jgi:hypothetical protein
MAKACAEGHDLLANGVVKKPVDLVFDVGRGDIREHAACLADVEVDITDVVHMDS